MCGIAGIFDSSPASAITDPLHAMLRSMVPRGPDDEGRATIPVQHGGAWHIGTRRLAILDLSPAGHQPMHDTQRGNWLAYNGEVFNFRELRDELLRAGFTFRSNCDTEVILHGYGQWGEGLFEKLEGMFAVAIWDRERQQMLLARDRHGIKPLYYAQSGNNFLFASEIRALLASGLVSRSLDSAGLDSYLKFGAVQEPLTLLRGIRQLPAGSVLRSRPGCEFQIQPYIKLFATLPATNGHSPLREPMLGRLRAALQRAVRLRLASDVPIGLFLSSGLDSAALAALAVSEKRDLRTFTLTFSEQDFAEGERAHAIARYLKTNHQQLVLSQRELLSSMPQALAALDQPSIDGINTYMVSKLTKQAGVTVALSGLGGDELFGGYRSFRQVPRLEMLGKALPRWMRHSTGRLLSHSSVPSRVKGGAWLQEQDGFGDAYFSTRMLLMPRDVAGLLRPEWLLELDFSELAQALRSLRSAIAPHDAVNRVSCLELSTYMRNMLLRDTDCMSMAHSLEVRVPFLDHQLTDLMLRIPGAWKVQGRNKSLLLEALADKLPITLISPRKRGFEFPWSSWLRGELRSEVENTLREPGSALAQAFDWRKVQSIWQNFLAGREHWSRPWLFYVLRKWTAQHLPA